MSLSFVTFSRYLGVYCLINKSIGLNKTAREPWPASLWLHHMVQAGHLLWPWRRNFKFISNTRGDHCYGIVLSCLMWHMSWSAIMPHYHRVTRTNERPGGWCPANQMTGLLLVTTQTWTNLRFVYIFSPYLIFGFWIKEGLWSGGRLSHVTGAVNRI